MNNQDIKDKAIFIVGFLAVFLTLNTFKETLSRIIVPLGDNAITLWGIIVFIVIILILSSYLFALSYTRSSFGKYQDKFIIRWIYKIIIFLANLLYSIVLILPLFAIITSIWSTSPLGRFMIGHTYTVEVFDIIAGPIVVVLSVINARFLSRKQAGNK